MNRARVFRASGYRFRQLAEVVGTDPSLARRAILGRRPFSPRMRSAWEVLEVERRARKTALAILRDLGEGAAIATLAELKDRG